MNKKGNVEWPSDVIIGLAVTLFFALSVVGITGFILTVELEAVHYITATAAIVLWSLLFIWGTGRLTNKLLQSKGINIY